MINAIHKVLDVAAHPAGRKVARVEVLVMLIS